MKIQIQEGFQDHVPKDINWNQCPFQLLHVNVHFDSSTQGADCHVQDVFQTECYFMMIAAAATSSSVDRNHTLLPWCNINTEQETGLVLGSEIKLQVEKKKISFYRWRPQAGRYWAGQVFSLPKPPEFQLCVITHRLSFLLFHTLYLGHFVSSLHLIQCDVKTLPLNILEYI